MKIVQLYLVQEIHDFLNIITGIYKEFKIQKTQIKGIFIACSGYIHKQIKKTTLNFKKTLQPP